MALSPLKVSTHQQEMGIIASVRRGFGSDLERGLQADLAERAELHFEPDGLRCVIEASRDVVEGREPNLA